MKIKSYLYKRTKTTSLLAVGIIFALSIFSPLVPKASATTPQWEALGGEGFSSGTILQPDLESNGGVPYVAFSDQGNGTKANVMKWNGTSWESVGAPNFSAGNATLISLAFDGGTPYVAFRDNANSGKLTIMKYDGTSWLVVGSAGFSDYAVNSPTIIFDNGILYVAYMEGYTDNTDPYNIIYNYNYKVQKYEAGSWTQVGTTVALPIYSSPASTAHIPLFFKDQTLYVALLLTPTGNQLFKLVAGNWESVGSSAIVFTPGLKSSVSSTFVGDVPYVIYSDAYASGKTQVAKYNGSDWVQVGGSYLTTGGGSDNSILQINGSLYILYRDVANSNKATVKKLDGNSWIGVGSVGGEVSSGASVTATMDTDGQSLYVAYRDVANGNKLTVMKYSGASQDFTNAETGKTASVTTPAGTDITCQSTSKASAESGKDSQYNYPLGLVNFCFDTSATSNEVSLTFETDLTPSQVVARKYNSTTKTYADIPGAVISETTINGKHALKLTYTIEDNGPLDMDATAGKITDPAGLGQIIVPGSSSTSSASAPNTGLKNVIQNLYLLGGVIIIIGTAGYFLYRARSYKYSCKKYCPGSHR